ncbi:elicitor peptide 6 [Mercurialis annua]|uniref:elicitor peptide 6 n=1 Tax=Mercurialis annua TaxID=3986 RepID=UPI002160F049|nr:elicitor peptide 6 [Mercurialis annua]
MKVLEEEEETSNNGCRISNTTHYCFLLEALLKCLGLEIIKTSHQTCSSSSSSSSTATATETDPTSTTGDAHPMFFAMRRRPRPPPRPPVSTGGGPQIN